MCINYNCNMKFVIRWLSRDTRDVAYIGNHRKLLSQGIMIWHGAITLSNVHITLLWRHDMDTLSTLLKWTHLPPIEFAPKGLQCGALIPLLLTKCCSTNRQSIGDLQRNDVDMDSLPGSMEGTYISVIIYITITKMTKIIGSQKCWPLIV